jgi:hypothetical protein
MGMVGVRGNECSCVGDACGESAVVSFVAKLHCMGVITCCTASVLVLQDSYMLCVMPEIISSEWWVVVHRISYQLVLTKMDACGTGWENITLQFTLAMVDSLECSSFVCISFMCAV